MINQIIRSNCNKNAHAIKSILFDNCIYEEPREIASKFNSYFATIGKNISNSFPSSSNNSNPLQYLFQKSPINSFFFTHVTNAEIRSAILSIKNKSSHFSTYPLKIIKILEPLISPLLAIIANKSLNTGVFSKITITS